MASPERRRPPTMADVAAHAGVSHQTVSRVLNGVPASGRGPRSGCTRRSRELGYRRNMAARMLASSRSRTIGVVTWGTSQFGPAQVLLGLEAAARAADYRLTLGDRGEIDPRRSGGRRPAAGAGAVEALIVVVPHQTVLRIAQDIDLGIPTVVVEGDLSRTPLTAGVDNVQGGRLATASPAGSRSRDGGPPRGTSGLERGRRADRGLARGARGRRCGCRRCAGEATGGRGAATRRAARWPGSADVTAVFAANDQMALGLIAALREAGRRVPEDVSVVGLRRPARGGVLRAPADHRAPGLRRARAAGHGAWSSGC